MAEYFFNKIEKKWQEFWEDNNIFETTNDTSKPKYYILDMFPYPSGNGLHVGHPEGYTASDIIARYKRMKGFNVLHPIGWDAFGLPAEQYALEHNIHPKITTQKNINNFRRQIKSLGFSYDWGREINTTNERYFRWTQWIFIQLHKKGLAYIDNINVNWCPELKTVLANEEVVDGKTEKGYKVIQKPMRQWMLKIPEYAQRLLEDLEELDWPEGVKEMQRNWIGKSVGAELNFIVDRKGDKICVYTTRPDTLFGASYIVLAPEHPLVEKITTEEQVNEVDSYCQEAKFKTTLERQENQEKTGVFTGSYAINPVNDEKIPIWISDYVLIDYGTGAIMAVPAHDERDFEFAKKFNLPIKYILEPISDNQDLIEQVQKQEIAWTKEGNYICSSNKEISLDALSLVEAKTTMIDYLQKKGIGEKKVNYRLRDWIFSRQRYWGEPFPVVHFEDGSIGLVDERDLPVTLPELEQFEPSDDGQSPLANAKDWLSYQCPKTGKKGVRETNTMPQWAGSCWYYLRYIDPKNTEELIAPDLEKYWMPVDLYIGGAEHAVLHLLYARFWHKVLYDIGVVSTKEPFQKLFNQGMILGLSYKNSSGFLIASDKVEEKDGKFFHIETKEELKQIPTKMSKSLKNVINPDDIVERYGADSLRLYEMFMGPLEATKPWNTKDIEGVYRFLNRVWRLLFNEHGEKKVLFSSSKQGKRLLHQTIKKVSEDVENMSFNTAISQMMVLVNHWSKNSDYSGDDLKSFILVLSSFAPHICEELWQELGGEVTLTKELYPKFEEKYLVEDEVEILIQINGKPIKKMLFVNGKSVQEIEEIVLADQQVIERLQEKNIKKFIVVPKRIVNIVV